ncbi:MAG: LysR substrate-binding domain-containing protein, partial [Chloroflexota bacterium]
GLTILSRLSVQRELEAGHLIWVEMGGFHLERPMMLLTARRKPSELLRRFVAAAREIAVAAPARD